MEMRRKRLVITASGCVRVCVCMYACMHVWVGGVGGCTDKVFQQLPHSHPPTTTPTHPSPCLIQQSLSIGERPAPPEESIVERCEPPAVKLPAGAFQSSLTLGGGLLGVGNS